MFERSCHFIHLSPIFIFVAIGRQNHRSVGTAMISTYLNPNFRFQERKMQSFRVDNGFLKADSWAWAYARSEGDLGISFKAGENVSIDF